MCKKFENAPIQVLFVGMCEKERSGIQSAPCDVPWTSKSVDKASDALDVSVSGDFDLLLLDVDQIEIFGPWLIDELRNNGAIAETCSIAALGSIIPPEFGAQLERAGADLVLERSQDPQLYVPKIADAMARRHRSSGCLAS